MTDHFIRNGAVCLVFLAIASLFITSHYVSNLLIWMAIAAVLASCMRFVLLIGEMNFSVAAFVGLGAYTSGVLSTIYDLPFWLVLPASGFVALLISVVFGYVTLRIKGPYFLLIGFAFGEALRIYYMRTEWLGGNSGMVGIFPPDLLYEHFATFVIVAAGLMILLMAFIERSRIGLIFTAIRDNDDVVRSVGIRVHWVKVLCFSIASFITGIAGSLQAYSNNVISPLDFGFMLSTFVLAYLKVGGENHTFGPVLGAVLLVLMGSYAQGFGGAEQVFYGLAIVLSVLFFPQGLMGWVDRIRMARTKPEAGPVAGGV